jgi:hypothetical protein
MTLKELKRYIALGAKTAGQTARMHRWAKAAQRRTA